MSALARQLRWLIGLRLIIVSSLLLPYLLQQLVSDQQTLPGAELTYLLAFATAVVSGLYLALSWVIPRRVALQAFIQFMGDLLLISGLVYYFGGVASPFSILYLVVIIVASALLQRRAGFIVASIAWVFYAATALGLHLHWIPAPPAWPASDATNSEVAYYLVLHLFAFLAVAWLTSRLSESVRRTQAELEQTSEHLARLEVAYRDVIASIPSGLITTGLDGMITSVNRAAETILRTTEMALLGQGIVRSGLFSYDRWRDLVEDDSSEPLRAEVELERADSVRFIGYSLTRLVDDDGHPSGFIVIFQDFTDQHRMREELQLRDRMAAIGEMAAGLAHELGNPLAAITGSVQMLSNSSERDSPHGKLVDIILKESQRLDRTVKSFLQFARPKERSIAPFDIARLLSENLELMKNSEEVLEGHNLELDLDPSSAVIVADPDQISQIFWNLARNALRAMPDGGTLRVAGRLQPDGYLMQVQDSGRGMTPAERANLFHPFRTLFDGGTGIGMSIVYRIVEQHQGKLWVDSEPGRGTTISVIFPHTEDAVTEQRMEA